MSMPEDATPDEQHAYNRLVRIHSIIDRSLFHIEPPLTYQKTMKAIETLAKLVHDYEYDTECIWYIGESRSCTLDSLLIGAYWFCVHYSGGMWSDEYRIQCVLSRVYTPGMTDGPEPETSEEDVYKALEDICGFKSEEE